ncbi:MAG: hypothetical protein IT422_15750 [Pirellulaceae bacterium]|nr:hypothetical protein [Pirellulaceae bacterium]
MTQRRTLVDGLKQTPEVAELERQFVYKEAEADKPTANANVAPKAPAATSDSDVMPQYKAKVPLTTRCTPQLLSQIKRASLQRQLLGIEQSSIQDIIEQALEEWLERHS